MLVVRLSAEGGAGLYSQGGEVEEDGGGLVLARGEDGGRVVGGVWGEYKVSLPLDSEGGEK